MMNISLTGLWCACRLGPCGPFSKLSCGHAMLVAVKQVATYQDWGTPATHLPHHLLSARHHLHAAIVSSVQTAAGLGAQRCAGAAHAAPESSSSSRQAALDGCVSAAAGPAVSRMARVAQ
ncbi:hypothetical protein HaLaN_25636 [Haematococcus lacustris]|uniref:Uncharacterized protein n=1 Tax=Haematococcus lacustris TaxID=44745 RepID=A0A699ZXZ4_HAELA|nr:hypothetical protein HaLaN_25636 [Haematococcus lacustris]